MLFDIGHIYISYLKIGTITDKFKGTYELNSSYYEDNNPKALKKFISKQKELEIVNGNHNTTLDWIGDTDNFSSSKESCDLLLNLDFFLKDGNTYHIRKQDFKVLELYKNNCTCLYFKRGTIEFKIYDKEYNVFAKHIIKDTYNNQHKDHYNFSNKKILQVLKKFQTKDEITIRFKEREPLVIQSKDYIGIIAPRILIEEGYGSTDGLYDEL